MKTGDASGRGFNPFGRPAAAKPYQVAIGRDFAVLEIQARTDQGTAQTRDLIARVLLASVVLAVGYAAGTGILKGNWSYLQTVWVPAGPLVGAMTAHYFRKG
jgi:hypothetical protein